MSIAAKSVPPNEVVIPIIIENIVGVDSSTIICPPSATAFATLFGFVGSIATLTIVDRAHNRKLVMQMTLRIIPIVSFLTIILY